MPLGNLSEQEADAVRAYVGVLQRRFGDRLVDTFVFGSRARGESHPDSDVDVMVVLEHPSGKDLSEARGLAFDIWLTYQVLLSIRAMSQQHWQVLAEMQSLFYRNALHDAVRVMPGMRKRNSRQGELAL
jgi:predicted nucleotidyltransferase